MDRLDSFRLNPLRSQAAKIRSVGRAGVTMLELLVVVGIIGLLAALILPGVMSAQAAARKVQCANHLHNLGLAMTYYAEANRGFPASGYWGNDPDNYPFHNWVVASLPWLEQNNVYDHWDLQSPSTSPGNKALAETHLAVLTCPDDSTTQGGGDLSYVANMGFGWTTAPCGVRSTQGTFDLNGNGICAPVVPVDIEEQPSDFTLLFQTAVFVVDNWPKSTVPHHTLDTIIDGASQTIMMSENVRVGFDPYSQDANWAHPFPTRMAFMVSSNVCDSLSCRDGFVDYHLANDGDESINSSLTQPEGESPWPSSFHAGGVHMLYVDGHVQFMRDSIDGRVYAALVSPQGTKIQGPLRQVVVNGNE